MRLLQIKLRGLGSLPVTNWVTLNKRLTLLRFSDMQVGRQILRAVQSLNPPYDCVSERPFSNLPSEEVLANGSRRAITPGKRTIVIGIFDTPAALVTDLGAIAPPLYETDRIEIGRRLDYTRWSNFVEISSSSRWSEVSQDIRKLLQKHPEGTEAQAVQRLLTEAVPAVRIKGTVAEALAAWLTSLAPHRSEIDCYSDILEKVHRAHKFSAARELLAQRLPQFLAVNEDGVPAISELLTISKDPQITPVVLIDCFDSAQSTHTKTAVPEKIASLAKHCQCLCFADDLHAGWDVTAAQVVDVVALK